MMKKENYDKMSSYSVIEDMNSEEDSDKKNEV